MSCLVPQFKWQPDYSFSLHSKLSNILPVRGRCVVAVLSSSWSAADAPVLTIPSVESAAIQMERMRLHSLEGTETSRSPDFSSYLDSIVVPHEAKLEAALATETLIRKEAVIAAAAAEALALARAAAKYAKNAVLEAQGSKLLRTEYKSACVQIEDKELHYRSAQRLESEQYGSARSTINADIGLTEGCSMRGLIGEVGVPEPTNEELELLETQLLKTMAVRSNRQIERKARRAKAAEKDDHVVKVNSPSRKKRSPVQDIDYSDPLRYFRGTMSTSKLLTAKEEIELSNGIQDLLKLEKLQEELEERCGGKPTFAQWATAAGVDQKTLRKRVNHGSFCRDKMVKCNIRLVISIAKNYLGVGMSLPDLVQEGCKGLMRGAEKFDASKGFRFSTYAHWWIKTAVRRSLSDQSRTIHIPLHIIEAAYKVKEARRVLYNENGKYPNNEEVAAATGLSMKRLQAVLLAPKAPMSLDQKIGMNDSVKPSDIIASPDAETLEELLFKQFKKQDLEKILSSLSEREAQVVRGRYGLSDGKMKTLKEMGETIGVSRERVRQIELSAFRKLKKNKRTKHLEQYLYT